MHKVMIVEDEQAVRSGLLNSVPWEQADCEVVICASNGAEALRLMEENLPDVALIDLEMPVMNGIELIREIRCRDWPVDVIVITCHADFAYAQEALRLNVFDYVLKLSASPSYILDKLRRVLMHRMHNQGAPEVIDIPKELRPGTVLALMMEHSFGGYDGTYFVYQALTSAWNRLFTGNMRQVRLFQLGGEGLACMFPYKQPAELANISRELIECVRRQTGRDVTVGISDFCPECGSEAIAEAKARAQLGFYFGLNCAYQVDTFPVNWNDEAELLSPVELLSMTKDDMEVLALVRDTVPKLFGRRPEMVRFSCVEWLYALSVRAKRKGHALTDPLSDLKQISQHLAKFSRYDLLELEMLRATAELTEKEAFSRLSETVKLTAQMVRNNPGNSESLQEIAQRIGCSYCHLSSQFKLELGMGFSEFRNQQRVKKAMKLLKETTQGVAEIAEALGYSSPYYFSAAFKKVTGVSPAVWRVSE